MFNKNQLASLSQELELNRIKTREKGNINLSYIEGFDVIDTANLIFGYGNWSYLISSLTQVSQEQNHNQNFVVCYKAVVKLIVKDENHTKSTSRQDVGFGTGTAKTLADSHENAGKEAVTDALKRAMRSFGNQFGNSLYDKTRNQQNQDSSYQQNQNYNQRPPQNKQQQQQHYQNPNQTRNIQQNNSSFNQYEYQSLFNLGLNIIEQNGFLVVTGENQYSYKDAIKACGFRFDSKSKTWYKAIEQGAA
jgi:DNA repair and recombination protein RAD52